jgi:two-component system response regulator MprA
MKVLVADDRGVLAPTCLVFLSWWGHQVEVVGDGFEALRKARAWRPDLVLAPFRLERMGGLSLLAALRAGGPREAKVVLVVAAHDDPVAPERALALGAAGVLEAPVGAADLRRVLERCALTEASTARLP